MRFRNTGSATNLARIALFASALIVFGNAETFAQSDVAPIPRPSVTSETTGDDAPEAASTSDDPATQTETTSDQVAETPAVEETSQAEEPEAESAQETGSGEPAPDQQAQSQTAEPTPSNEESTAEGEPAAEANETVTSAPEATPETPETSAANDAAPVDMGPYIAPGIPDVVAEFPILRTPEEMPDAVRMTWMGLRDAARSGNIEALRPLMDDQDYPPTLSFAAIDDPILYLRSISGDAEGREIMAILLEVLEMGFRHIDVGTNEEMYVWPYYVRYPLDKLSPEQTVEMFTLLTAGDYQDMISYGAYIFFRVGIDKDGVWQFFVAGD